MTKDISTDVWGRWLQTNGVWNFTDLPDHYPECTAHANTHTYTNTHSLVSLHTQLKGIHVYLSRPLQKGVQTVVSASGFLIDVMSDQNNGDAQTDQCHLKSPFMFFFFFFFEDN